IGAYVLYWTQFSINTTIYRSSFLVMCLALPFILYPLTKPGPDGLPRTRKPGIEEMLYALTSVALMLYLLHNPNPMFAVFGRSNVAYGLGIV
ncbi:hypothetical protein, partial [Klebsiella michiganensis]|uniref:hypothetical protein n=1 Tax=Klebsiella michiganensis TaxID=1134687 RepID=UPI0013D50693